MTAGRLALQLIRAAYGTVLVLAPGQTIRLTTARDPLDPLVVVEVLDMSQVGHRDADSRVQVGGAVPGNLEVVCRGPSRTAQELADAAAAGHVQLEAVHPRSTLDPPRAG